MSKTGPIVLIEDDIDDQEMFASAVADLALTNELIIFPITAQGMNYLISTEDSVFIIFCDINLPGQNGLDFKKNIDANPELRNKSIPFVFFSTSANQHDVNKAYREMTIQGFFKKPSGYKNLKSILSNIFSYWQNCKHPNSGDLD